MRVSYSLKILLHERRRYFPAVIAVAFSSVLVTFQSGLLVAMLQIAARPVTLSRADIWLGSSNVKSVGFGRSIPQSWRSRLSCQPEVERVEEYIFGFALFQKEDGSTEQCYLIGTQLENEALGPLKDLTPIMRRQLSRPGTLVGYEAELPLLGLPLQGRRVGEIAGRRVEVVGVIRRSKGAGLLPGLFCSLRTARQLLPDLTADRTTYLVGRCRSPRERLAVAERLRHQYSDMAVLTTEEFARQTWWFWLVKTRAGLVVGFSAGLGLMVGAVITSQTLYAATVASWREYAVLRALGIPRRRMAELVLSQSFWVAVAGVGLALPMTVLLARLVGQMGIEVNLPLWLLATTQSLTVLMALGSGMVALRSLQLIEPAALLR